MSIYNFLIFYINEIISQFDTKLFISTDLADKLTISEINLNMIWKKIYSMLDNFIQAIPVILLGLLTFAVFFIIGKIIRNVIKRMMRNRRGYNIGLVLARMAQWLFVLAGFMITLAIIFPSITPADLLAGLGIGSIALGFAFKDILQNYLAGILILLQEPFKIGDEIRYKEFEGRVEFIDTRTTFIKSYDGRRVLIPNGEIYTNAIIVNTTYDQRCTEYDIGIGCSDDLQKASDIILKVLKNTNGVMKNPEPEVLVIALDDFKNQLRARWWTIPYQIDVLRIRSQVLEKIKQELYASGIDMPFPTQVVLWHDQTEKTDGSRITQREGWPPGQHPPPANTLATSINNSFKQT